MKTILLIFIFIGILLIVVDITRSETKCSSNKIIYRYIPRTLDEELNEPAYAGDIFESMFNQSNPWIGAIDDNMHRKTELINKYFISQV